MPSAATLTTPATVRAPLRLGDRLGLWVAMVAVVATGVFAIVRTGIVGSAGCFGDLVPVCIPAMF
jgi:hypothetical protein